MDQKDQALYYFRNMVYVLYQEIGALQPRVHREIAKKADLRQGFFQREREKQAAELYLQIEKLDDPEAILRPFHERTSLTLEDLRRAFAEGRWQNRFHEYTFGGPRWARIAEVAIQLKDLIERQAWEEAETLAYDIKKLKHNNGKLIDLFERVERYR